MKREVIQTKDGSNSLFVPELNETYHSIHGAIAEAKHVFLHKGFDALEKVASIDILEIGFGTGLNALLTALKVEKEQKKVRYTSIEKYPIPASEALQLNYGKELKAEKLFGKLHDCDWEKDVEISAHFELCKLNLDLIQPQDQKRLADQRFDLIYFDAFAPNKQNEMWSFGIFELMHKILNDGGILTTYCCQGEVRRTMIKAGFEVEKTDGPPGKREMLLARKKAL